jgi:hypothetical protein
MEKTPTGALSWGEQDARDEKVDQLVKMMVKRLSHEPDPAKRTARVQRDLRDEPEWARDRVQREINSRTRILLAQMAVEMSKQEALIKSL